MRIILLCLLLASCEDNYRYPCQNPHNWEKEDCKPPICSVNQNCPDMLIKPEDMNEVHRK
jgi:hypothetical protein